MRNIFHPDRRKGRRARPWPIGGPILALVLLGTFVAAGSTKPPPVKPVPPPPPPPTWIEVDRPIEFFNLNAPELLNSALTYEARQSRGGRQDILTFGKLDGRQPFVRLTLDRLGRETAPPTTLFVDLVRMAAAANLSITGSLMPENLPTRFGDFETSDVDLAVGEAPSTPCLGFRASALQGSFKISGFACGVPSKPLSRPALACLLDRLDLNSAGADQALASFFAAAELRRNPGCAGTELAPLLVKAGWIDQDDAPPPLRLQKVR